MWFLKRLFIGLFVVVAVLAGVGLLLPSNVHMERTLVIDAPPATIHAIVNNLRRMNEWSPWAKLDPNTVYTYSGPAEGVGSKVSWKSEHPSVGVGSQVIVSSQPSLILSDLDFGPNGVAKAFFRLEPASSGTKVVWGFDSDFGYNLMGRYFGLLVDKWVGADYEQGLANLKTVAEAQPKLSQDPAAQPEPAPASPEASPPASPAPEAQPQSTPAAPEASNTPGTPK